MDFMPESLALRFLIAFLVVLALIGIAAWVLRRFGSGRMGTSGSRGRQPRLAVIDYASVDARRRLILVRRDNVEHLLMTGGPTDVVVESNIVRAVAAPREAALPRDMTVPRQAGPEPLPRAIPLPENGGAWPLAPEPVNAAPPPLPSMPPLPSAPPRATPPRATPRIEPAAEESTQWPLQPHAEAPARPPQPPQRDTLAALADELSARPAPRPRAGGTMRGPALEPRTEVRPDPRSEPWPEPRIPAPPVIATPAAAAEPATADQNLTEMAQRLEAALRKPGAAAELRDVRPAAPPLPSRARIAEPEAAPPPASPAPSRPPASPDADPPADAKPANLYDNLEQEMASLLGRPTNKS
jgi:hypothetical protein